jgi:hypothetical protein
VRHWTEDEARAYLPRLRVLLAALQRSATVTANARANGHATVRSAPGTDPGATSGAGESGAGESGAASGGAGRPDVPVVPAAEALAEIEAQGIVLRDVDQGIVDFPSRHPGGREVHLCWRQGEDDLGWWHLPEAGFAGRHPLPLPPEL